MEMYEELAPLSADVYERLLNPRIYPYGEVLLTLRELVAVKRSLWSAAFERLAIEVEWLRGEPLVPWQRRVLHGVLQDLDVPRGPVGTAS